LPGILSWAVLGCLEWQHDGLREPAAVRAATNSYRADMDVLGEFLEECTEADRAAETTASEIYQTFGQWSERSGEKQRSQKWLGLRLSEHGFLKDRNGMGRVSWQGIKVRTVG